MRVEAESRARARVEPSPKALVKRRERTEAKARAEAEAAERRRHPQPYELGPVGFQVGDIVKLDLRSEWAVQGRLVELDETGLLLDDVWTYDNAGRIANDDNRLWPGTFTVHRAMVRSAVKLPENEPRPWGV